MTARQWFPCCGHCPTSCDEHGAGHPVPCLVCQTDAPTLLDDPDDARDSALNPAGPWGRTAAALGRTLMPWQRHAADVIGATIDDGGTP